MKNEDLTIKQLTEVVMTQAKKKKFGTKPQDICVGEKFALLHCEVSEAYEAYRHNNIDGKDGFKEELGDILTRLLHLAGIFNIDLQKELLKKVKFNKKRTWDWQNLNEKHSK